VSEPQIGRPEQRFEGLVNREMYQRDAMYRSQVTYMRTLMRLTELAMEDEDVEPSVRARVLNRLAYGTPSGADAYERIELLDRLKTSLEKGH
jgi:hypothetical protein